jgi:Domain of unknown function (DUF6089)
MKKLQLFIITFLLFNNIFAQSPEIGLNIGGSVYSGDIEVNPKNFMRQKRSNIGVFVRIPFDNNFAVRGQAYHGQFFADEKKYPTSAYRAERGLSFNTTFTEVSARFEWNFLNLDNQFYFEDRNPTLKFYGFGGFGALFFRPQTNFNTQLPADKVAMDKSGTYSTTAAVLAFGAGGKFNITDAIAIGAEVSGQKPFTDYIDGISNVSTSKTKDYYFYSHLMVSYSFGGNDWGGSGYKSRGRRGKSGCPTF